MSCAGYSMCCYHQHRFIRRVEVWLNSFPHPLFLQPLVKMVIDSMDCSSFFIRCGLRPIVTAVSVKCIFDMAWTFVCSCFSKNCEDFILYSAEMLHFFWSVKCIMHLESIFF